MTYQKKHAQPGPKGSTKYAHSYKQEGDIRDTYREEKHEEKGPVAGAVAISTLVNEIEKAQINADKDVNIKNLDIVQETVRQNLTNVLETAKRRAEVVRLSIVAGAIVLAIAIGGISAPGIIKAAGEGTELSNNKIVQVEALWTCDEENSDFKLQNERQILLQMEQNGMGTQEALDYLDMISAHNGDQTIKANLEFPTFQITNTIICGPEQPPK
jgi:hypothetical protein